MPLARLGPIMERVGAIGKCSNGPATPHREARKTPPVACFEGGRSSTSLPRWRGFDPVCYDGSAGEIRVHRIPGIRAGRVKYGDVLLQRPARLPRQYHEALPPAGLHDPRRSGGVPRAGGPRRRPPDAPDERGVDRGHDPGPGGEHQRPGRSRRYPLVPRRLGVRARAVDLPQRAPLPGHDRVPHGEPRSGETTTTASSATCSRRRSIRSRSGMATPVSRSTIIP